MTVRRFLLAPSFARLIRRERGGLRHIEGFFPEQRERSAWVRLEEDRGLLFLTTAGPHDEAEDKADIPVAHAQALLAACAGTVDSTRTVLPIGDNQAVVDEILRPCVLHLVTLAFDTAEEAGGFGPPEWFGPEVTGDLRYTHRSIALRGLAAAPEITLSDAMLNRLIDALDGRSPATAQTGGDAVRVTLDEIEEAMLRDMERTRSKGEPA
jgi:CYTH domain-containing protein